MTVEFVNSSLWENFTRCCAVGNSDTICGFFSVDGQLHCIDIDSTVLDSLDCNAVQEDCVTNTVTKCYMILVGHETVKTLTSFLSFSQCTKFHRLINCIQSIAKFYMKRVSSPLIVVQASKCFLFFFFFQSLLSSTKVYLFPFGRTLRKFKTRICCDLREVLTDMRPKKEQRSKGTHCYFSMGAGSH